MVCGGNWAVGGYAYSEQARSAAHACFVRRRATSEYRQPHSGRSDGAFRPLVHRLS
jgi:hypothetical protein